MDFGSFAIELTDKLVNGKEFHFGEDNVRFYADGFVASEEDKQIYEDISNTNARYHNSKSKTLKGNFLIITQPLGNEVSTMCRFSVDKLYKIYKKSGWDSVLNEIRTAIQASKKSYDINIPSALSDYDLAKSRLIIRPINFSNSSTILEQCVYKRVEDIALALYMILKDDKTSSHLSTTKVMLSSLDIWGKTIDDVWDVAMANTQAWAPPRMYTSMSDILHPAPSVGDFMNEDISINWDSFMPPVVTTTRQVNGAVALFYPGVLERLSELVGDSFYVAFTSIHEAYIHKYGTKKPSAIRNSLLDTVNHGAQDELLTRNVFFYDAGKKRFYAK